MLTRFGLVSRGWLGELGLPWAILGLRQPALVGPARWFRAARLWEHQRAGRVAGES